MNESLISSANKVTFDFNTIARFVSIFHAMGNPNFSAYVNELKVMIFLEQSPEQINFQFTPQKLTDTIFAPFSMAVKSG